MNIDNRYIMYWHFSDLARSLGFRAAVQKAKALGFCGIELLESASGSEKPLFSSVEEARQAKAILDEENMVIACYSVGATLYRSDDVVNNLKMHADLAAALGSPYLHHTLYLDIDPRKAVLPYEEIYADILPRAIEVARYCKIKNITCLYEAQGMYFNGLENFGRFFRAIQKACDNVGVCGDMGNSWFVGTAPADFFRSFASDIRHVHVKDYRRQADRPQARDGYFQAKDGAYLIITPTGTGVSDISACMDALNAAGYPGYYAIEQELAYPEPYCQDAASTMRILDRCRSR